MDKFMNFYLKHQKYIIIISLSILIILFFMPFLTAKRIKREAAYTEKEDVALYIKLFHELPHNYVTNYGLKYMQHHELPSEGYIMGGDTHINSGTLASFGVTTDFYLKECDIAGESYDIKENRGVKRLVYTCNTENVRVFYSSDHYSSFIELTSFRLQLTRNIFWIIFGCYMLLFFIAGTLIICLKVHAKYFVPRS